MATLGQAAQATFGQKPEPLKLVAGGQVVNARPLSRPLAFVPKRK